MVGIVAAAHTEAKELAGGPLDFLPLSLSGLTAGMSVKQALAWVLRPGQTRLRLGTQCT